jgi:S-formylglutathione hydrolase FrmB
MIHAMPLDRGWRIVVRFAIIGFSIGSLAAFLIATYVPGLFATVFVIVCPGMLLTYPEMWVVGWGKLLNLSMVVVVNTVIYTIVGAIIAGLTTKPKQQS